MLEFLWIFGALLAAGIIVALWIIHARRDSIVGVRGINRYFTRLAKRFGFAVATDDYFLQVTGEWEQFPVLIHPHHFEGPGSITLIYTDSGVPFRERTWIEPTCSLGRAVVDWKNGVPFGFEFAGDPLLSRQALRDTMENARDTYPFAAITIPGRLIFSPLAGRWLEHCPNFVILLALDAGREPAESEIRNALDAAVRIARDLQKATQARS